MLEKIGEEALGNGMTVEWGLVRRRGEPAHVGGQPRAHVHMGKRLQLS